MQCSPLVVGKLEKFVPKNCTHHRQLQTQWRNTLRGWKRTNTYARGPCPFLIQWRQHSNEKFLGICVSGRVYSSESGKITSNTKVHKRTASTRIASLKWNRPSKQNIKRVSRDATMKNMVEAIIDGILQSFLEWTCP